MTTALKVYRRSELEASDCLYRYQQVWRLGVEDTSDFALRGIGFHRIAHAYIMALVDAQIPQDVELAREAFTIGIALAKTPDRLIPELRQLWDFFAEHFELPLDRFVAAEEKGETSGKVFTPDLVLVNPERNELEIQDFKTFFVALTETQAKVDYQARFYTKYAMERWPNFSQYRFTFNFVRLGKYTSVVFHKDDLDVLEREVAAQIAKIQQAEIDEEKGREDPWPATAGPSCTYCELKCPLMEQSVVMPKRLLPDQAVRLGAFLIAAEGIVRNGKKALKAFCAANGPVDCNGVEWNNRPSTSRSYPVEEVLKVLNARGIAGAFEGNDKLTLSQSALKPLLKQFPQLVEDLAAVVSEKTSYRFSAKKPGVGEEGEDE